MGIEDTYCRGPFAAMINKMPGYRWIPSRNVVYSKTAQGKSVESGECDGEIYAPYSTIICVECKAGMGSVNLQDWKDNQRVWWRNNCMGTLYYIALWMYPEFHREGRMDLSRGRIYLVPPLTWLDLEQRVQQITEGREYSVPMIPAQHRKWSQHVNVHQCFAQYALIRQGQQYKIPESHPLWNAIHSMHIAAIQKDVLFVPQPVFDIQQHV